VEGKPTQTKRAERPAGGEAQLVTRKKEARPAEAGRAVAGCLVGSVVLEERVTTLLGVIHDFDCLLDIIQIPFVNLV